MLVLFEETREISINGRMKCNGSRDSVDCFQFFHLRLFSRPPQREVVYSTTLLLCYMLLRCWGAGKKLRPTLIREKNMVAIIICAIVLFISVIMIVVTSLNGKTSGTGTSSEKGTYSHPINIPNKNNVSQNASKETEEVTKTESLPKDTCSLKTNTVNEDNLSQYISKEVEESTKLELSSKENVNTISMYDFFLEKYKEEEKKILEEADHEIKQAKNMLEITSNPIKQQFLQSFIDYHKFSCISDLLKYSRFKDNAMIDELDPLFAKVAEKVVTTQKCDLLTYCDYNHEKIELIGRQLRECGIVTDKYPGRLIDYKVRVKTLSELNNILATANGRSLLSKEDKVKLNNLLNQRHNEIVGEHNLSGKITINNTIENAYLDFVHAYDALSSCNGIWEITSSSKNSQANEYAKTLLDRKTVFSFTFIKQFFNYLDIDGLQGVPIFKFESAGVSFYFYPEYVIVAQNATNFEVIPMENISISFRKTNFVDTLKVLTPKDAKLVRFTYKYVDKNGERDARFPNNPQYAVYEYGEITFNDYQQTMQFSNSEIANVFFKKFLLLKNGGNEEYVDAHYGITQKHFEKVYEIVSPLCDFYDSIKENNIILTRINPILPDSVGDRNTKLLFLFLADLVRCFEQLGHDSTNIISKEGLPMVIIETHVTGYKLLDFDSLYNNKIIDVITGLGNLNKTVKETLVEGKADNYFYMDEVFKTINRHDLVVQYFSLLYRFFSVVAKADDKITPVESRWLEKLMSYSNSNDNKEEHKTYEINPINQGVEPYDNGTNPLDELRSLIGLTEVKDEVTALANFVKIQRERENKGMKSVGMSYHCVFTGNPGTGKTTVARILAAIYKDLGILKKGHLVETDRSGLVAEYVGQTAVKTNKIIDSALDGVLFIDEAYSLVQGGGNDYGQEAISTLLKRMEDDRDRLVVVLAGYSEEMKQFIDSNPGLQSRFSRYIHFADYTSDELEKIFMLNVQKNQYKLDENGQQELRQMLSYAVEHKDKNFGNGRFVRNMFEKTIQNQATRLSKQAKLSAEELSTLTAEDLPVNN